MSSSKPPILRQCAGCGRTFKVFRLSPERKYCSTRCANARVLGPKIGQLKNPNVIPGVDSKHLGALAEIMACEWLIRQGYEMFRNISQHGLADYVAWKPGEPPVLIDVKTVGSRSLARRSKAQEAAGVKILYVDRDRRIFSLDRLDFTQRAVQADQVAPSPAEDSQK